uniref:Maestro/Maestro-like HEAT-repeats domain-containing protein n=1 Tax=Leptobrachium leishanense TaxID=445787 RepID=A0A8C5M5G1_9ANUR
MPLNDLTYKADLLKEALLQDQTSHGDRINIYNFLIQIANIRGEAADILVEELIPVTCVDMLRAEEEGHDQLQKSAKDFLMCLSRLFHSLVFSELQFLLKPETSSPSCVLQAMDQIKHDLDVPQKQMCNIQGEEKAMDSEDMAAEIRRIVAALVSSGRGSIDGIVKSFLPLLHSTDSPTSLVVTAFYAEILNYSDLVEKSLLTAILQNMALKMNHANVTTCCQAIRGIGNTAERALKKIKTCFDRLLQILQEAITTCGNSNIIKESLRSLSRMVIVMSKKHLRESFEDLVAVCKRLVNHKDTIIQRNATWLLGLLAKRSREYFSGGCRKAVKECLHLVLWKVHSSDPRCVSFAMFALRHMLPLLGCAMKDNIEGIYQELAKKKQLKDQLFVCIVLLAKVPEVSALLKHIAFLTDHLKYGKLSPSDVSCIWMCLAELMYNSERPVRQAARAATIVLSKRWKSLGTVKASVLSDNMCFSTWTAAGF